MLGLLSPPTAPLVRLWLHIWPTVSTYLCPSEVQTACMADCHHILLHWEGSDRGFGLLFPTTSAGVRFRLHAWLTISTYSCSSKAKAAFLAHCLHLPLSYQGADCMHGLRSPPTAALVKFRQEKWPSVFNFRLLAWLTVSSYSCSSKIKAANLAHCLHLPLS